MHADNGSPMKGKTMLRLGVAPSRRRPSVSNDNAYSESLFKTLKYRPDMPVKAFENLLRAPRLVTYWCTAKTRSKDAAQSASSHPASAIWGKSNVCGQSVPHFMRKPAT
jgi:transposase InsO family protein